MSQILDADLIARFRSVRLLSLDLDGTLTDGGLYYADDGSELRKFFVQDGFGILLVKEAGIEVCLITMSDTPAIRKRIDRLKIRFGHMGEIGRASVRERVGTYGWKAVGR